MLGLRTTGGVTHELAVAAGVLEILNGLAEQGLVRPVRDPQGGVRWRTTEQGWLLGNRVFEAVWTAGRPSRP
jgi:hypothetical protein